MRTSSGDLGISKTLAGNIASAEESNQIDLCPSEP